VTANPCPRCGSKFVCGDGDTRDLIHQWALTEADFLRYLEDDPDTCPVEFRICDSCRLQWTELEPALERLTAQVLVQAQLVVDGDYPEDEGEVA
jgi:hypothetical protein